MTMTIRKGEPWGTPGPLPPDSVVIESDAEARAVVTQALRDGTPVPPLALLGGDLARTVGASGDPARLTGRATMHLPVDLGVARLDGEEHVFVAHAVARRSLWRGRLVAAMNAEWLDRWDVAPRAHPNDGLLDVVDGDPSLDDRLKMRSRLPSGQHVPHPAIRVTRTKELELTFDRPLDVWLDGVRVGRVTTLGLSVRPDALLCIV